MSPSGLGGFWTASLWRYELYHWSEPDSLLETLVRDVQWFPATQDLSRERLADMYRKAPPPAVMWNVHEDQGGRLWTYALVPDADWKPGPIDTPVPEWSREQLDTMLEIIDPAGPRLIAQRRFDHVLGRLFGSELVHRVVNTASGDTRAEILRPKLLSP